MFYDINYINCNSFEDAIAQLSLENNNCAIIAGGTDVIIGIRNKSSRFKDVRTIIDLKSIPDIKQIKETGDEVIIGSYATFTEIAGSDIINRYFPLLVDAVKQIGNLQVRNRATIGGNIVNCAPCADSVPPLLVYDAKAVIRNVNGNYKIPLSEFLISPYKTKLKSNEILEAIALQIPQNKYKGKFIKLGKRKGVAISRLTFAVLIEHSNNKINDIKISSGAITPIATRFFEVEKKYISSICDDTTLINIVTDIATAILNKTGIRWSYPYKLPVFQQLLFSELKKLLK
jgi:CO/xanthine dehydrogenase FAD-binding subunit